MSRSLNILFVSSELYPFAKESGIGDVSFALPLALKEIGHDVRIIFPKYGVVSERKNKIHYVARLRDIHIKMGNKIESASIKSSFISNSRFRVQAYVVSNDYYFDTRKGIYHDPKTWLEYPDNAERFIFFNKAVVETCTMLGWKPHIIHCNDWQSALIPAFIKELYPHNFKKTKTVFTIHNFYRQGVYDIKEFEKTGFKQDVIGNFKHKNKFNFIKGALNYSNYITTVSKSYADEILKDSDYSNGLNASLKKKKSIFKGILNGIDEFTWNPKKDEYLKFKLKDNLKEFKQKNKLELLKAFGFDSNLDIPVIGMIPRIGYQKGTQLLVDAASKIFKNNFRLVMLGEGDSNIKKELKKISEKYPDKFKVKFEFNVPLSHLIEAGSDFFLMPSQYEPFGLNFIYSLIYGTLPIVRRTGGLKDLAIDINLDNKNSNAIVFDNYDIKDLNNSIERAVKLYKKQDEYFTLTAKNLIQDYSWGKSAIEYHNIYKSILKEPSIENEENK